MPRGYDNLRYKVRINGNGTKEQFAEIHAAVMATSPNFYNLSRPWLSSRPSSSNNHRRYVCDAAAEVALLRTCFQHVAYGS